MKHQSHLAATREEYVEYLRVDVMHVCLHIPHAWPPGDFDVSQTFLLSATVCCRMPPTYSMHLA